MTESDWTRRAIESLPASPIRPAVRHHIDTILIDSDSYGRKQTTHDEQTLY